MNKLSTVTCFIHGEYTIIIIIAIDMFTIFGQHIYIFRCLHVIETKVLKRQCISNANDIGENMFHPQQMVQK